MSQIVITRQQAEELVAEIERLSSQGGKEYLYPFIESPEHRRTVKILLRFIDH